MQKKCKMRILICIVAICIVATVTVLVDATSYYNAYGELQVATTYFDEGLYLEIIKVCDDVLLNHELSKEDLVIFNTLKTRAENNYKIYVESQTLENNILGLWEHGTEQIYFGQDGFCRYYEFDAESGVYKEGVDGTYRIEGELITVCFDDWHWWLAYNIYGNNMLCKLRSGERLENGDWWVWYVYERVEETNLNNSVLLGEDLTPQVNQINQWYSEGNYLPIIDMCNDLLNNHTISLDDRVLLDRKRNDAEYSYWEYVAMDAIQRIESWYSEGNYLSIIDLCNEMINNPRISGINQGEFREEKNRAEYAYNEYLKEESRWKWYSFDGWGINFKSLISYQPTIEISPAMISNGRIRIWDSYMAGELGGDQEILVIDRCPVGQMLYGTRISSPDDWISYYVSSAKKSISYISANLYKADFYVLSSNTTAVGDYMAKQTTIRTRGTYKNAADDYDIRRYVAFQKDGYIYGITISQLGYEWSDRLYGIMEAIRNSISFY